MIVRITGGFYDKYVQSFFRSLKKFYSRNIVLIFGVENSGHPVESPRVLPVDEFLQQSSHYGR